MQSIDLMNMNNIMPMRPRSHQLESESRTRLQDFIPSQWVCRFLDQDYGVDAEIEIFEDSGAATGYKFLVQLKSTDEQDQRKAMSLRMPFNKMKYYESLDLPLLIVKYHAPTNQLFARWFHSLDPYYGRQGKENITFNFDNDDILSDSKLIKFMKDVEMYRDIRSPRLPDPLYISVTVEGGKFHGIPAYEILSHLREISTQIQPRISFEMSRGYYPNEIKITKEILSIKMAGAYTTYLHTHGKYEIEGRNIYSDIMVMLGIAIARENHEIEAANIVDPFLLESSIIDIPELAGRISTFLAKAGKLQQALEVAEKLFQNDFTVNAAWNIILPHMLQIGKQSIDESRSMAVHLKWISQVVEKRGDLFRAGTLRYNAARLYLQIADWREAIREYRCAGRLDKSYLDREYYWRELAGALFSCSKYKMSAKLYNISLSINEDKHTRLCYADALMFSGAYMEAEKSFEIGLANSEIGNREYRTEWCLKRQACSFLQETLHLDRQSRRKPELPDPFIPHELGNETIERICWKALESDALFSLAWFNLGISFNQKEHYDKAMMYFLLAALSNPCDSEAWLNTLILAYNKSDMNFFAHILQSGFERIGERFLLSVIERFGDKQEELYSLFSKTLDSLSPPKHSVIRIHTGEGGAYKKIDLVENGSKTVIDQ